MAKERLTVMLACSQTGEKLKPLVIGKAENPRCFKNTDKSKLPVTWKFNRKSWMTREIFNDNDKRPRGPVSLTWLNPSNLI